LILVHGAKIGIFQDRGKGFSLNWIGGNPKGSRKTLPRGHKKSLILWWEAVK